MPSLLQDVGCFMGDRLDGDLGSTLTLVAHRPRHAPPAWRAYVLSQAVVMVVLHLDQVAAAHLPQRLVVVAVLLVHQEKCQWAVPESVLHVLSAILRMSLVTVNAWHVLLISTKIWKDKIYVRTARKANIHLLDLVDVLKERAAAQHRHMEVEHQEVEHQEKNVWMTTRD